MDNDTEIHEHLLYITGKYVKNYYQCMKLRGVTSEWKNDTANITFYFSEQPTEEELEEASDLCTEIIAHMPGGMLEDQYLVLKFPKPLPDRFLAYQR